MLIFLAGRGLIADGPVGPPVDQWTVVGDMGAPVAVSSGWSSYTLRQRINVDAATGDSVRVTFTSAHGAVAARIFASTIAAGSTGWNSDYWVPVTFGGTDGVTTVGGSGNQDYVSDPFDLPLLGDVGHEQIVISMEFSSGTVSAFSPTAGPNASGSDGAYLLTSVAAADSTDDENWTGGQNYLVRLVETLDGSVTPPPPSTGTDFNLIGAYTPPTGNALTLNLT